MNKISKHFFLIISPIISLFLIFNNLTFLLLIVYVSDPIAGFLKKFINFGYINSMINIIIAIFIAVFLPLFLMIYFYFVKKDHHKKLKQTLIFSLYYLFVIIVFFIFRAKKLILLNFDKIF